MCATPNDNLSTAPTRDQSGVLRLVLSFLRHYWDAPRQKPKWTEVANIILNLLIAGAAICSAWVFQGQLSLMRDADRPWVRIEVAANTDWVPESIAGGPLSFDEQGRGSFTSKITLTNVGRSVASHAYVRTKAVTIGIGDPPDTPLNEQRRLCSGPNPYTDGRKQSTDPRYTIFPDDTQIEFDIQGFDTQQIKDRPEGPKFRNGKPLHVFLVGCADYDYLASAFSHQTGFVYEVYGSKTHQGIQTLMTIPVDKLTFEPYAFGGKYAY
jgi:hypothetical protein